MKSEVIRCWPSKTRVMSFMIPAMFAGGLCGDSSSNSRMNS